MVRYIAALLVVCLALVGINAQGAERGLAPWAGGSMPPIGSSFGYRGSIGGYGYSYSQPYYSNPPMVYYQQHYQPPITIYDRPRITTQPHYYVPTYSSWQVVPKRGTATKYVWTLRCGCFGESYWVLERQAFSW